MLPAFQRWLCKPNARWAIVGAALLLASPSLGAGLTGDDYFHKLVLAGHSSIDAIPKDPSQLFVWHSGDPAQTRAMMEVGMIGWWADPEIRMAYFRPLAALTHRIDHWLWPDTPWLMHAQSLLWFGLALYLLAFFYQRVLATHTWLPALALLLFAVDDAHGMTIGWIANRNALVAFVLAAIVLLLHDRAAQRGDRHAARAAPGVLLIALLAGESALAVTGFLFAYALFLDPAPRKRALLRLLPHALVTLGWAAAYRALGYGARYSGLVIDPGSEPLRFLAKAAERVPVLLAGAVGFPPSDPWEFYPALAQWLPALMMAWVVVTLVVMGLAFKPILQRHPSARFFALGALLSALPLAAQFPHDRLLLFITFGTAPLLALLIGELFAPSGRRVIAWAAVVLHLGIAPLWLPLRVRAPLDAERMIRTAERSIDDSKAVRDKTVVLMNPPVDAYAGYLPMMREAEGRPRPRALRWLATGGSEVTLARLDAHTLRVTPKDGFLALSSERMQRNPERRMPLGHLVRFSDLTIEVKALTQDGRPAEILARFAHPLEDARYVFLQWRGKAFAPFALPAVGQTRTLPRVDFTSLLP